MIVLYSLQTRMIFPGAASQGTPEAELVPPPGTELVQLKSKRGDRVVALFGPALTAQGQPHPNAAKQPTILYFYGNGMCLSSAVDYDLERFRRLGVNVMIAEYLGYGLSGGSPGESGCYETADATYAHLATRRDVDPALIIAVGRSLGGAVAIDLASRKNLAGLVAFCTFTRMSDMVSRQFPVLPLSLLLRHRFESLDKISRVSCPVLIGHGSQDSIVPCEMSGRLAASAKGAVTSFTVEGADHNDLYEVGGTQVFEALKVFIDEIRRSSSQKSAESRDGVSEDA
jgi:fermentation-respiration switch protein FrsA (DUF1100 family)